jgi:hypothetical protein
MKISKKVFLAALYFSMMIGACKFPMEKLQDIDLDLNGNLVNTLVKVKILTEDSVPSEKLNFFISGKDANQIFDLEGKTNFNAEGGEINLILAPNANPTIDNPIVFTINLDKQGYIPIKQDVFIFSKEQRFTVNLVFKKEANAPNDMAIANLNLNFTGKSISDTLSFVFKNSAGIQFTYKYPLNGLVFIKKSSQKYRYSEQSYNVSQFIEDSNSISKGAENESFKSLNDMILQSYGGNLSNINPIKQTITTKSISVTNKVGYSKPSLDAFTRNVNIYDTVAKSSVNAAIFASTNYQESGYYDETGNYINKSTNFTNSIGIPEVYFYDSKTGLGISPFYLNLSAPIVEITLPENNYTLFADGFFFSSKLNSYYHMKSAVNLSNTFLSPTDNGNYKLIFKNDLLNGRIFLNKNQEKSCGFAKVLLKIPGFPINRNINGLLSVKSSKNEFSFEIDGKSTEYNYIFPAFTNSLTQFGIYLNHQVNICNGNPPLLNESLGSYNLCDNLNNPLTLTVNSNLGNFVNVLQNYKALTASAIINCPSGNTVLPPTIDLKFWKLGCELGTTEIKFENGQFFNPGIVEPGATYVVRFDKVLASGKPVKVYDTLTFDTSIPELVVEDKKYGYWKGSLFYRPSTGFELRVLFDNRKLKYSISGCK